MVMVIMAYPNMALVAHVEDVQQLCYIVLADCVKDKKVCFKSLFTPSMKCPCASIMGCRDT